MWTPRNSTHFTLSTFSYTEGGVSTLLLFIISIHFCIALNHHVHYPEAPCRVKWRPYNIISDNPNGSHSEQTPGNRGEKKIPAFINRHTAAGGAAPGERWLVRYLFISLAPTVMNWISWFHVTSYYSTGRNLTDRPKRICMGTEKDFFSVKYMLLIFTPQTVVILLP